MTITTVIKRLESNYERAKQRKDIKKPIAWALYQTWRWADEYERRSKHENYAEMD